MAWRFVVLTSAGATRAWTLDSVARLRAANAWAQRAYRLHEIDDWRWWRLPDAPTDTSCPDCGYHYAPGRAHTDTCQCGRTHAHYACVHCGTRVDPPHADGCAPVPHDPAVYRPTKPLRHRPR